MRTLRLFLVALTFVFSYAVQSLAATVQTLEVPSAAMKKSYKASVAVPDSYARSTAPFPVMYLLHGAWGHFDDWGSKTPDKTLVQKLTDQYNLLIVMTEGETFSWYLDSPINKDSQFETYLSREVVEKIDASFRTVRSPKGRVITGLSMGGHGALYLATRHPDIYGAAGSMSGAVDLSKNKNFAAFTKLFESILGPINATPDIYSPHAVVNMADRMKANALPLIIDCGVDDFLIEHNRDLHRRLVENKTPHDYTERPGGHTWEYWGNSLPYHALFFHKYLQSSGTAVEPAK
jgi:putative tributyrin esterase